MLLTEQEARDHLRVDDDEEVAHFIQAASIIAQNFMNRNIYESEADLELDYSGVGSLLDSALLVRDAALVDARQNLNCETRDYLMSAAHEQYKEARAKVFSIIYGRVIDEAIKSAIKLIIGDLYKNRENSTKEAVNEVPASARYILMPYRVQMGV